MESLDDYLFMKTGYYKCDVFSSLGCPSFLSKYNERFHLPFMGKARSKVPLLIVLVVISFIGPKINSNADRFLQKIDLLFQFPHNFWDESIRLNS